MWSYNYTDELYHYGIPGMRWGHRKTVKYQAKARTARESAKEWNEMAKYAREKGNVKKANKYSQNAKSDLSDARRYESKANVNKTTTKRKTAKEKARSGKNAGKKALQKIARTSIKSVSYSAQVGMRALQNYSNMQRINYWTDAILD